MAFDWYADDLLRLSPGVYNDGHWGLLHEFGHNHQVRGATLEVVVRVGVGVGQGVPEGRRACAHVWERVGASLASL